MAPKPQKPKSSTPSNKRKVAPEAKFDVSKPNPKKLKFSTTTSLSKNAPKQSFTSAKTDQKKPWLKEKRFETKKVAVKDEFESKKESRLRAKELAEAWKKKRKKHYSLEQVTAYTVSNRPDALRQLEKCTRFAGGLSCRLVNY